MLSLSKGLLASRIIYEYRQSRRFNGLRGAHFILPPTELRARPVEKGKDRLSHPTTGKTVSKIRNLIYSKLPSLPNLGAQYSLGCWDITGQTVSSLRSLSARQPYRPLLVLNMETTRKHIADGLRAYRASASG